jgi:hypothetical protein
MTVTIDTRWLPLTECRAWLLSGELPPGTDAWGVRTADGPLAVLCFDDDRTKLKALCDWLQDRGCEVVAPNPVAAVILAKHLAH